MRKLVTIAIAVAVVGAMTVSGPNQANARPEYQKAFLAKYTKLSQADQDKKCAMCHGAENKKQRSAYAEALGKALGAKMVKDVEKINAALTEVESKEYEDGKTYGSLLNEGKLPAPFKE
jgi:predicted alpha/beta hydrolase family esterase